MLVTIPDLRSPKTARTARVEIADACPRCDGPRGEILRTVSYDGSVRLHVDGWANPCGHLDDYEAVAHEAGLFDQQPHVDDGF
ncbi:MAG: hypothetical protein Q8Q02_09165 [Nocardioides sp.]|nr:hypothetical protein [Nocardioides sp.]